MGVRLERDPATRKDAVIINYEEAGDGVAHRKIGQSSKPLPVERRLDGGEIRRVNVRVPSLDWDSMAHRIYATVVDFTPLP